MNNHHKESLYSLENMEKNRRDDEGRIVVAEGVRTSACLIALRQEIWSVLFYHRPFRLPLAMHMNWENLTPTDDFTWTNRIILWCADVLRFCFGSHTATTPASGDQRSSLERWQALKVFDDQWRVNPPPWFQPLYYAAPDPVNGIHIPVIWQTSDAHILAMQHLELGRMLLAVYDPRRQRVGIGSTAANRALEHQLRDSILYLCGLGLANKHFQAGMCTGAIGISVGGECLHRVEEREAIVDFLRILEEEHAWPTKSVVAALRDAWGLQRMQRKLPSMSGPASV